MVSKVNTQLLNPSTLDERIIAPDEANTTTTTTTTTLPPTPANYIPSTSGLDFINFGNYITYNMTNPIFVNPSSLLQPSTGFNMYDTKNRSGIIRIFVSGIPQWYDTLTGGVFPIENQTKLVADPNAPNSKTSMSPSLLFDYQRSSINPLSVDRNFKPELKLFVLEASRPTLGGQQAGGGGVSGGAPVTKSKTETQYGFDNSPGGVAAANAGGGQPNNFTPTFGQSIATGSRASSEIQNQQRFQGVS